MKLIKKLFSFMLLIMIFCINNKVHAATSFPSEIEAIKGEHLEFSSVGMAYKYTVDNIELYCVEWKKIGPTGTVSLMPQQYGDGISAGLASIISTVEDGNKEQYYYASIAIHLYAESDYLSSGITEEDIKRVQALVDKAKAVENSVNSFNVTASVNSRVLTQIDDYFISEVITVDKKTGDDFTVTLSDSKAEVINKTANSFQIRIHKDDVPANGIFNLSVTVNSTKNYGTVARYIPSDNENYQIVIPDIILTSSKTKSANLTFIANKTGVLVVKVDDDGHILPGATLQIFDSNGSEIKDADGNVLYKWVSTGSPQYIEGLSANTYILREVKAPDGYELLNDDVVFTISPNGTITIKGQTDVASARNRVLLVSNTKTKVKISKQDITTGKELPGATLQILDSEDNEIKDVSGNTLYKWVSTDEPHYIEGIPVGKYILVETAAPNGYVLNQEKIQFEIKDDGEVVSVVMKNTPIVDVPATGFNTSLFVLCIGIIAIVSGTIFIGLNVKRQN